MEVRHFDPAPERPQPDFTGELAIKKMQDEESERQRVVGENEKEVLCGKTSEKFQEQGWVVVAIYVKDGRKYHKLYKEGK